MGTESATSWAWRFLQEYVQMRVQHISGAHSGSARLSLSAYDQGRVDAYHDVLSLCDRVTGAQDTPQPDGTGEP